MTTNRQLTSQPRTAGAMPRLLTLGDVIAATALSRSAVYAMMAESRFPKPIRIGSRAVRWVEQEVLDFIASRPRAGSDRPSTPPVSSWYRSSGSWSNLATRRPNVRTLGLARGRCAPPSNPRHRAALRDSPESGGPCPRAFLAVRRCVTAAPSDCTPACRRPSWPTGGRRRQPPACRCPTCCGKRWRGPAHGPRGRRDSPRRPGTGGGRRRLAGVRAQVPLGRHRLVPGRPADRRADRDGSRRVREDGLGGARRGPLLVDGGPAPRAGRRGPRAHPDRTVRSGDGQEPQHRAARLAEDLRPVARRLQPRARLETAGRPGEGEGAAARPPRLHRGGEAADRPGARGRPARVDPGLPDAARRARCRAEPHRRRRRPGGSPPRGAAPGQELPDRPEPGRRETVAAEGSVVRA